jgi:hypothetical protein
MRRGWDTDRGCIQGDIPTLAGIKAGVEGWVDGRAPLRGESGGARRIGLDDGGQSNEAATLLEIPIYAKMIASEDPRANDGDANRGTWFRHS